MDLDAVFGLSTDGAWTSGPFGLLTEIISQYVLIALTKITSTYMY